MWKNCVIKKTIIITVKMSTKLARKFISLSETDNHMASLVLTTSMTSVQWSIIQDHDDFSLKVTRF